MMRIYATGVSCSQRASFFTRVFSFSLCDDTCSAIIASYNFTSPVEYIFITEFVSCFTVGFQCPERREAEDGKER